jgi:hypothetical protein
MSDDFFKEPSMKFKLWTEEEFAGLNPCIEGAKFARLHGHNWPKIWESCKEVGWLIWWLRKAGVLEKTLSVRIAVACAEHVLPIYERRKPGDDRPRKASDAAKAWLENPCEGTRKNAAAAAAAAAAAYAAADAAAAAYADAAADYAADAAADAAYAAADYAAAARKAERKWQAGKIRELVGVVEWVKGK